MSFRLLDGTALGHPPAPPLKGGIKFSSAVVPLPAAWMALVLLDMGQLESSASAPSPQFDTPINCLDRELAPAASNGSLDMLGAEFPLNS